MMETKDTSVRLMSLLAWAQIWMVVSLVLLVAGGFMFLALSSAVAKERESLSAVLHVVASLWPLVVLPAVGFVACRQWRNRLKRRLALAGPETTRNQS